MSTRRFSPFLMLILALFSYSPGALLADDKDQPSSRLLENKHEQPVRYSPYSIEKFDIIHYLIDIAIDPTNEFISGSVTVTFTLTEEPLDTFFVYLKDNMNVDSIKVDGIISPFSRSNGRIYMDVSGRYSIGDTTAAQVFYDGYPVYQGFRFFARSIYSLSEPNMARNWFPCYDEPWDKATSEMLLTVPDTLYGASNGLLADVVDNLDGTKTYHWNTSYPHTTYTISVAVSNYDFMSLWYCYSETDSMEMPLYVFPEKAAQAQVSFSNTPAMMSFFSSIFGQYPYINETYGTAIVNINGGMENFTCTIIGPHLVDGTNDNDWVLAHEMAHSWFGNSVTMRDWPEIWLNEGFATYADALWSEHNGGRTSYLNRMEYFKSEYFNEDAQGRYPIYDPEFLWGATVYEKGAWILHMLRYLLGDEDFFNSLRQYHSVFMYGSATTEDFRGTCESVSSKDLTSFFDQWVYQAGYPEYEMSWWYAAFPEQYDVSIRIKQKQQNAPVFTIPVEVRISTTEGDTLIRLPVSSADETHLVVLNNEPLGIAFDPDDWILKKYEEVASSTIATGGPPGIIVNVFPNPAGSVVRFDFYLPRAGRVTIDIFDVLGRRVAGVLDESCPARWNVAYWHPGTGISNRPGSGIYFYKLKIHSNSASGKISILR